MSILFLQISNLETKNVIGTYLPLEMQNSSLKDELEKKSNELLNSITVDNESKKRGIDFKTIKEKAIKIFYYTTNRGILYLSFIEISLLDLPKFEENNVYDLFLNLENQNIIKLVNVMNNMQDMNEIEGKSVSIKDTSLRFRRDSKGLENKMRRNFYRNSIIFVCLVIALAFILYLFFK